ncbi:RNA polymerase B [Kalmusia sp. IMI 367209]|nr:RNA polymerase B [Kalmusia sp. IMI 367209]
MDDDMQEAPAPVIEAPTFKAPKMVSRPKPPVQQDEEMGAELKLGDFEGEHALSISEARAVVTAIHSKRRKQEAGNNPLGGDRVHNDSLSIQQFVDYLEMFSRYKQSENLHAMGAIFDSNPQFTPVERAMMGSLCPDTADEAKTLIPSLATKLDDEALQPVLDELQKLRMAALVNPTDITMANFSGRGSLWIDGYEIYLGNYFAYLDKCRTMEA